MSFQFNAFYRSFTSSLSASSSFSPAQLFKNGEKGAWFDPSDLSTLFKDAAGTTTATADGDPVGLMLDKSGNNNHASQTIAASRPVYRTDGNLHWLEFDGADDYLNVQDISINSRPISFCMGFRHSGLNTLNHYLSSGAGSLNFALWSSYWGTFGLYSGRDTSTKLPVNVGGDNVVQGLLNGSYGDSELSTQNQASRISDEGGPPLTGLVIGSRYTGAASFSEMGFYGLITVVTAKAYTEEIELMMKAKAGLPL